MRYVTCAVFFVLIIVNNLYSYYKKMVVELLTDCSRNSC